MLYADDLDEKQTVAVRDSAFLGAAAKKIVEAYRAYEPPADASEDDIYVSAFVARVTDELLKECGVIGVEQALVKDGITLRITADYGLEWNNLGAFLQGVLELALKSHIELTTPEVYELERERLAFLQA